MAYKDLTGQVFNLWTVLEDAHEVTSDRDHYWICKCQCGTIRKVRGSSLKKGISKSCGCIKKISNSNNKLLNQTFDKLTVIKKTDKRSSGEIVWLCKCECGNLCERSTSVLKRSGSHACDDCNAKRIGKVNKRDLVGQKFGLLTVIKETKERKYNGNIVWECKCDCGNITKIDTNSLTTGNTKSCGCINYSIGEKNIKDILDKNNIEYITQFTDKELGYKKFDFALLRDNQIYRLIEFDGQQHYNSFKGMWANAESLETIQEWDRLKNEYAKSHNLPLVRIPYWYRDNITLEMILGDQFLIG